MCVCGCIITHDQSIKGKVMITVRLMQKIRRKVCFISEFHDFPPPLQVKSLDLLEDLDL